MNVLMLCSGDDAKFSDAGYAYPKNLIEIEGKPMIQAVFQGFGDVIGRESTLMLTLRQTEMDHYHTQSVVRLIHSDAKIIAVPNTSKGAACVALLGIEDIDNEEELLIINGDIIIESPIMSAVESFRERCMDGGAVTFENVHPRWSFVKCSEDGLIVEASEKRPISRNATMGVYYFRHGKDFVSAAENMIRKDAAVDGLFYICPVFNELVLVQKKLGIYKIDGEKYFSLSTPKGVENYQKHLEKR